MNLAFSGIKYIMAKGLMCVCSEDSALDALELTTASATFLCWTMPSVICAAWYDDNSEYRRELALSCTTVVLNYLFLHLHCCQRLREPALRGQKHGDHHERVVATKRRRQFQDLRGRVVQFSGVDGHGAAGVWSDAPTEQLFRDSVHRQFSHSTLCLPRVRHSQPPLRRLGMRRGSPQSPRTDWSRADMQFSSASSPQPYFLPQPKYLQLSAA